MVYILPPEELPQQQQHQKEPKVANQRPPHCQRHSSPKSLKLHWITPSSAIWLCSCDDCAFPLDSPSLESYLVSGEEPPSACHHAVRHVAAPLVGDGGDRLLFSLLEGLLAKIGTKVAGQQCALKHSCWCSCLIHIFLFCMDALGPVLRLCANTSLADFELISALYKSFKKLCQGDIHSFLCAVVTRHHQEVPLCSQSSSSPPSLPLSTPDSFVADMMEFYHSFHSPNLCVSPSATAASLSSSSILDFFAIQTLSTYYCSACGYQRVCRQSRIMLISVSDTCYYASPSMIKSRWRCIACQSRSSDAATALLETKIVLSPKCNILMVHTERGLSHCGAICDTTSGGSAATFPLGTVVNGRLCARYIVVEREDSRLEVMLHREAVRHPPTSGSVSSPRGGPAATLDPAATFDPAAVRMIVWTHTKPFVAACRGLTACARPPRLLLASPPSPTSRGLRRLAAIHPPTDLHNIIGDTLRCRATKRMARGLTDIANFEGYKPGGSRGEPLSLGAANPPAAAATDDYESLMAELDELLETFQSAVPARPVAHLNDH